MTKIVTCNNICGILNKTNIKTAKHMEKAQIYYMT
uniref:Uncharacterized protein n=1 Tax=uncultured Desulfobacterium sp. TaxID=201089 RepID=E1YAG0_9BACT|nr:unknown protein [uncultured Desulfobacterium sp.]